MEVVVEEAADTIRKNIEKEMQKKKKKVVQEEVGL